MLIRLAVCFPTFNNASTLLAVVQESLQVNAFPHIVVDDGSDDPIQKSLEASRYLQPHLESGRLQIIRHTRNLGKGRALQSAIRFAIGQGYTHLATIDSDGQHFPEDLTLFYDSLEKKPHALFIGKREFQSIAHSEVPQISRFGRAFSNFWVRYQTEVPVSDSQSGFRIYPLFFLQSMKFFLARYDFEIEVLIRLIWKQVPVVEVPIRVYYPPQHERVSHFRKGYDNARISALNAVLVIVALMKGSKSPVRNALSLGLGVWIGASPLLGLHALIAAAVSFLGRLSFPLLFLGTQISNPFFLAPLIAIELKVGSWLSPQAGDLERLWWGWTLVGSFLGGSTMLVFLLGALWRNSHSLRWTGRIRGGRMGNAFLKGIAIQLGLPIAYFCARFVIPYFYLFAPQARRASNEYWKRINPNVGFFKRQSHVFRHFFSLAQILLDRIYIATDTNKVIRGTSNGMENLTSDLDQGVGMIALGAHFGAWDVANAFLPNHGFRRKIHLVRFENSGVTLQKVIGKQESHIALMNTRDGENSLVSVHRKLQEGEAVALMGDRPGPSRYQLVPFLGGLAFFDSMPFLLASMSGISIVQSFGYREVKEPHYHFQALSPIRVELKRGTNREESLYRYCKDFAASLEVIVKNHPHQWLNFFPFFSTMPDGARSEEGSKRANHQLQYLDKNRMDSIG